MVVTSLRLKIVLGNKSFDSLVTSPFITCLVLLRPNNCRSWTTKQVKKLIKLRKKRSSMFISTGSEQYGSIHSKTRNICKAQISKVKHSYEKQLVRNSGK